MMLNKKHGIALLHYSAPPVVGGVENVILAHARLFHDAGIPATVIAGKGEKSALPRATELILIPELDSQMPQITEMSQTLEQGLVPPAFEKMVDRIMEQLAPALRSIDVLIVHNVFTKHFNLPLTTALFRLLDDGTIRRCVAWCHDSTWTSPRSRIKVHPRYPWELLRTYRSDITYVTVSQERQRELSNLFGCAPEQIHVIYNGVDASELLALSAEGLTLIERLDLWHSDLNLILPVRVTRAKNLELALHVVAALKERGIRPRLVVTGPPDPHDPLNMEYFRSLLRLREQLGVIHETRFVYEAGPVPNEPYTVEMSTVAELLRASDALFMPSHQEGFGMPVLEAGLVGLPVFSTDRVPAANEIGGQDVIRFSPEADPGQVAELILKSLAHNSVMQLRRRVRQNLTWHGIFKRQILPLLTEVSHEVSEQG
jgi:glycosyltransferase involved in cell wall biosynthesis